MDRAGCADAFLATGHRATGANMVASARRIGHVDFADVASPFPFGLMIPQSETERLLEEHLQSLGVAVERGVEVTALTSGDDAVTATLRNPEGVTETLSVAWLAGCDGAHSIARRTLGFAFEGETDQSDWVLADIHLSGNVPPADEIDLFWHQDGLLAFFPITPGRFRMIADAGKAKNETHRADPTLAEVQALIDARVVRAASVAADPILAGCVSASTSARSKDYRVRRVFSWRATRRISTARPAARA